MLDIFGMLDDDCCCCDDLNFDPYLDMQCGNLHEELYWDDDIYPAEDSKYY